MYPPFFQFVLPRVGQVALGVLLYLNFLQLPLLQLLAFSPLLFYGVPVLLILVLLWIARDPLGLGMVFAGYLTALYCLGTGLTIAARLLGGTVWNVWQAVWLRGTLPWAVVAVIFIAARLRAVHLYTTTYELHTTKPLPGGKLRIVQLSDIHPSAASAMNARRIPELRAAIEAARPDILVMTGDIFDEYTSQADFEAFCALFGELDVPLGKYCVLGNHDLFHHWKEPCYDRAALELAFARAGVRILEDSSITTGTPPVRVTGRKDYMATNGNRCPAATLARDDTHNFYTIWLDHEPREFKAAAAAGANVILSGHTHGGQVWPTSVVGVFAKNELNYGKKDITPTCAAIVSGGTGTWGYKFRNEGKTEIVVVEVTQVTQ